MEHLNWTQSEKRLARAVFEKALNAELSELMIAFKKRAAAVDSPEQMWALREYLERAQREIDGKYDYRYSQILFVFGRLLRERRIDEADLRGLDEKKMQYIHNMLNL